MTYPWPRRAVTGTRRVRPAGMKGAGAGGLSTTDPNDPYFARVLKHIPAEVVGVYVTLDGIARGQNEQLLFLWIAFGSGLVLTPLYLWRVSGEKRASRLILQVFAFCVWVIAIGGPFAHLSFYRPAIGSILLVLTAVGIPMIVRD
jgi:hypothetical protein